MGQKIVVSFLGWSNTGKTTFIERVLSALIAKGVPCAALKCTRHPGAFQLPGKDSTRFFQTGAESALMGGPETILALRSPPVLDDAFLDRLFPDTRVVLIEGGTLPRSIRVLVAGEASTETELKLPLGEIDALVTGNPGLAALSEERGVRHLAPDDIQAFLALLEDLHGS